MLEALDEQRLIAQDVKPTDGFDGNTNNIQTLDNQTVEEGMGFTFILQANGKVKVWPAPIRNSFRAKRNADGSVVNGEDGKPIMEQTTAPFCHVHIWKREMVYEADGSVKHENGHIVYATGSKWEPVMEVGADGTEHQAVRRFYPGSAQRRAFEVMVGQKPDPENPGKTVEDPNVIVASKGTITTRGSFIDTLQSSVSMNEGIKAAAIECGIPVDKATTDDIAQSAKKLIKVEVVARPWTRNPNYVPLNDATTKARRQTVYAYNYEAI